MAISNTLSIEETMNTDTITRAQRLTELAKTELECHLTLITLEYAASICEANGLSFDALSPRERDYVMAYGKAMVSGRWLINGAPIIISANGRVIDGVLRLLAAVTFRTCFPSFLVLNVNESIRHTVDTHIKRTTSQRLYIKGADAPGPVATAITVATSIAASGRAKSKHALTSAAAELFLADHPGISDAVEASRRTQLSRHAGIGVASAFRFLAESIDLALAEGFFEGMEKALNGKADSPILKAAAELFTLDTKDATRPDTGQILVRAWNAVHAGRKFSIDGDDEMMIGLAENVFSNYRSSIEAPTANQVVIPEDMDTETFYRERLAASKANIYVKPADPEWAKTRLEHNGPIINGRARNRPIDDKRVDALSRDIYNQRWAINGQTIKFDYTGQLLDGQHRLSAILRSGVAIPLLVVTGLDPEVFFTLDIGASRPFADHLREDDIRNYNEIQAALRAIWRIEQGSVGRGDIITNSEMLDMWDRHPDIIDYASGSNRNKKKLNRYLAIAFQYLFSRVDPIKAAQFFKELSDLENMGPDHPILVLSNELSDRASKKRGLVPEHQRVVLIIKAWNHWINGETVKALTVTRKEPVPEIEGLSRVS